MERFKVYHFEKDNPSEKFPRYHQLSSVETNSIRQELANKLGLDSEDPLLVVNIIDEKGEILKGSNADDPEFQLSLVLSNLGICPEATVYINWYRFDRIDKIGLADLVKYFNYIWYPGPDDIDIFDLSLSWVLSISHEGYIKLCKVG